MVEGLKVMIKENRLFYLGKRRGCCVVLGPEGDQKWSHSQFSAQQEESAV